MSTRHPDTPSGHEWSFPLHEKIHGKNPPRSSDRSRKMRRRARENAVTKSVERLTSVAVGLIRETSATRRASNRDPKLSGHRDASTVTSVAVISRNRANPFTSCHVAKRILNPIGLVASFSRDGFTSAAATAAAATAARPRAPAARFLPAPQRHEHARREHRHVQSRAPGYRASRRVGRRGFDPAKRRRARRARRVFRERQPRTRASQRGRRSRAAEIARVRGAKSRVAAVVSDEAASRLAAGRG